MIFKSTGKTIVFLILLAIISGIFWNAKVWGSQVTRGDDQTYQSIALDILDKGTYTDAGQQTDVEPLYPSFVAMLYKVFGRSQDVVRIFQIAIFTATIVALYLLSKSLTTPTIALFTSSLAALFYGLVRPTGSLNRETLIIFFAVIIVLALYKSCKSLKFIWFGIAGAVLGLYVLLNSSAQFFFIFAIAGIILTLHHKITLKQVLIRCIVFMVTFGIVLLPWIIRNKVNSADTVIAPRAGLVLLRRLETAQILYQHYGLNLMGYTLGYFFSESINPNIIKEAFQPISHVEERQTQLLKQGYSYGQIDSMFVSEFKSQIFTIPQKYIGIVLINFIHLNNPFVPHKGDWANVSTILLFTSNNHAGLGFFLKAIIILGLRAIWLTFFGLVLYGIYKIKSRWRSFIFVFIYIAYINLVFSASHGIPRFSLPMYPFYILLAIIGLSHLQEKYLTDHQS